MDKPRYRLLFFSFLLHFALKPFVKLYMFDEAKFDHELHCFIKRYFLLLEKAVEFFPSFFGHLNVAQRAFIVKDKTVRGLPGKRSTIATYGTVAIFFRSLVWANQRHHSFQDILATIVATCVASREFFPIDRLEGCVVGKCHVLAFLGLRKYIRN